MFFSLRNSLTANDGWENMQTNLGHIFLDNHSVTAERCSAKWCFSRRGVVERVLCMTTGLSQHFDILSPFILFHLFICSSPYEISFYCPFHKGVVLEEPNSLTDHHFSSYTTADAVLQPNFLEV